MSVESKVGLGLHRKQIIIVDGFNDLVGSLDKRETESVWKAISLFTILDGSILTLCNGNDLTIVVDHILFHHTEVGDNKMLFESIYGVLPSFGFTKVDNQEFANQVEFHDYEETKRLMAQKKVNINLNKDKIVIDSAIKAIGCGHRLKTSIIDFVYKECRISKPKIVRILDEHTGNDYSLGHRVNKLKGSGNSWVYYPLP